MGQAGGADREITRRRELVFQGRLYGMSLAAAGKRAAELITMLELEVCADRPGSMTSMIATSSALARSAAPLPS